MIEEFEEKLQASKSRVAELEKEKAALEESEKTRISELEELREKLKIAQNSHKNVHL